MSKDVKKSVLIIEHDTVILENLSKRFNDLGLVVITADDGYEGYVRACKETPDYIIAETLLPNIDGFKISRLLKYDERYSNIILVLITTNDIRAVDDMFKMSGADNIIKKPFKFSKLIKNLNL